MGEIPSSDEQGSPKPKWDYPSLEEEREEIERTAEHLGIAQEILFEAFKNAGLEELSDTDWTRMQNCDSRDGTWTAEEVHGHLKDKRDFARIEEGLKQSNSLPAPLVLFRPHNPPYLIAGNSRLLGCRALKLRPVVLALRLKSEEPPMKEAA